MRYFDGTYTIVMDEDGGLNVVKPDGSVLESVAASDLFEYVTACTKCVEASHPKALREASLFNFVYYGDTPIGDTWGIVYSKVVNEASPLVESNFDTIVNELKTYYPDDYRIERFGHDVVGPIEHILVRIFTDEARITAAGLCCARVWQELENYMVLDEELWGIYEWDAFNDLIESECWGLTDEQEDLVRTELIHTHNISSVDEWSDAVFEQVLTDLGIERAA